jgi:type IV secretory pathway VirB10-like protein
MRFPWISPKPKPEPEAATPATVQDQRPQPAGNLPRQAQTWTILGLASLMILVLIFGGRPSAPSPNAKMPTTLTREDSSRAIQEYRQYLDDEQRRLDSPPPSSNAHDTAAPTTTDARAASARSGGHDDRAERAHASLFADQLAFSASARKTDASGLSSANGRNTATDPAAFYALALAQLGQSPGAPPSLLGSANAANPAQSRPPASAISRRDSDTLPAPPAGTYRLTEGSLITTTLTHRLDGELASPVTCLVTADVYAPGSQVVLVPAGSWVIGESRSVSSVGQRRLAILFHRILRPDGSSIALDAMATSAMGEAGLQSHVNTHYWSTFAAAGAVGLIAGLAEASTDTGADASLGDHYRQGVAGSLSQSSLHILDAYLNRLPTIRVDEGTFVTVRLLADLDMPPYLPRSIAVSAAGSVPTPTTVTSPRSMP